MTEWTSMTDDEWPDGDLDTVADLYTELTEFDAASVTVVHRDDEDNVTSILGVTRLVAVLIDLNAGVVLYAQRGDIENTYARLKVGCVGLAARWISEGNQDAARALIEVMETAMPEEERPVVALPDL